MQAPFGWDASLIPELISVNDDTITKEDQEGLFFIQQNELVSVKDYTCHFNLSVKTAQRRIANLFEKWLLDREGANRWLK